MPVKTLQQPAMASGPLVRLLLVVFAMMLQHTGATTSASDWCAAENLGCVEDAVCTECISDWVVQEGGIEAYTQCLKDFDFPVGGDRDLCTALSPSRCCIGSAFTSNYCLGNSAYMARSICFNSEVSMAAGHGECTALVCGGLDNATVEADDDAGVADGSTGVAEDDVGVVDDDVGAVDRGTDDADGTVLGASDVVASSSPSIMLTVPAIAFLAAAPILAVSL